MWPFHRKTNDHVKAAKAERVDSERRLATARNIIDSLNEIRMGNHFAAAIEATFRKEEDNRQ